MFIYTIKKLTFVCLEKKVISKVIKKVSTYPKNIFFKTNELDNQLTEMKILLLLC